MVILADSYKKIVDEIKKGNVPTNYKKTGKGHIIPFDWEEKDFYSCVNIINGQVNPTESPYVDMKHIGLENIEKHTGRLLYVKTAREEKLTSGKYYFDRNTVLYGKIRPELGKVYFSEFEGICSADIYPLEPLKGVSPQYLKYLITDRRFYRYAVTVSMRTGMPKVNRQDLGGYFFMVPSISEQTKIADTLLTWDKAIELKEKLIEEKKKQKTGLMQKLLTGKVRLPGFDGEWKEVKLGSVLKKVNEKSHITNELELYSLTIENGVTPKTDRYNREFLVKTDNKKYKITKLNDIVYNPANLRFGAIAVNRIKSPVLLSPIYEVLRLKNDKLFNLDFIGQLLTWDRTINLFSTMAEGTLVERMAVKIDTFLNVKFKMPNSLEEQTDIAFRLDLADKEIDILEKEIVQLKEQKKGLMQLLLTGIVRVNTQEN